MYTHGLVPGDIFSLNAGGQRIIVVNSAAVAIELLDRRAGNYTDRPPNIAGCEIMSGGLFFAFSRYTEVYATPLSLSDSTADIRQVASYAQSRS